MTDQPNTPNHTPNPFEEPTEQVPPVPGETDLSTDPSEPGDAPRATLRERLHLDRASAKEGLEAVRTHGPKVARDSAYAALGLADLAVQQVRGFMDDPKAARAETSRRAQQVPGVALGMLAEVGSRAYEGYTALTERGEETAGRVMADERTQSVRARAERIWRGPEDDAASDDVPAAPEPVVDLGPGEDVPPAPQPQGQVRLDEDVPPAPQPDAGIEPGEDVPPAPEPGSPAGPYQG